MPVDRRVRDFHEAALGVSGLAKSSTFAAEPRVENCPWRKLSLGINLSLTPNLGRPTSAAVTMMEVSLEEARSPFDPSAIEEPLQRKLYDYWAGKCRASRLPGRADIDPLEMQSFLPGVFLADTAETLGRFRYRLYGTADCDGFESDRTSLRFADLLHIENYNEVNAGYWRTYQNAVPVYFKGRIVSSLRAWLRYSRVTVPLSNNGEHVDMILGGVVFFTDDAKSTWP